MLITIDKRGSINLPASIRKELGLQPGSTLDLSILAGGGVALTPVAVYPTVRLSTEGIAKLQEGRQSGTGEMPDWMRQEMGDAEIDSH
jgi:AbrB family looped-hinge helix DNA binding protein